MEHWCLIPAVGHFPILPTFCQRATSPWILVSFHCNTTPYTKPVFCLDSLKWYLSRLSLLATSLDCFLKLLLSFIFPSIFSSILSHFRDTYPGQGHGGNRSAKQPTHPFPSSFIQLLLVLMFSKNLRYVCQIYGKLSFFNSMAEVERLNPLVTNIFFTGQNAYWP